MNSNENIKKLIEERKFNFRDFQLTTIEERKGESGDELVVEGVACTFNQPTVLYEVDGVEYKEQVSPEAFADCKMDDVIFNYNHSGRVYARTRNKSLTLSIEKDGLHIKASLMPDDEGHKQLYRDIKSGNIDKMSFAFTVRTDEYDTKERLRTITAIDRLFDVSAVDIPAYNSTQLAARSFVDAVRSAELLEEEKREKELNVARAKYFYFKE